MDYAAENKTTTGAMTRSLFRAHRHVRHQPDDPAVRVVEFKQLVDAIHARGMGVILDVVYNHTAKIELLEDIEPNYYYFMDKSGKPKGSFGGGQVGSTHAMTRRLIVDSLVYLTDTYKVDGYRFDMMGNLDLETVQIASEQVSQINPNTLWIGEGWRTWNGERVSQASPRPTRTRWTRRTRWRCFLMRCVTSLNPALALRASPLHHGRQAQHQPID